MTVILSVLIAVLLFGVLIFIHELGHFLCARLAHIRVEEFSIGFGPKLFTKVSKKTGTAFSVRALPFGGYVKMPGESGESDDPDSFRKKKVGWRMLVTVAGATMNILLGFLLMLLLVCGQGVFGVAKEDRQPLASTVIAEFTEDATSSSVLHVGDKVLSVNGVPVHTGNELVYEITMNCENGCRMTVLRDGEKVKTENISFPTEKDEETGITVSHYDFFVLAEARTFPNVMKHAFFRGCSTVKFVLDTVKGLVVGRFGVQSVSGPVGATAAVADAAKSGFWNFVYFACVITVNLGVVNLLPLPALDGGRMVFLLFELITGKAVPQKVEDAVNTIGFYVLFAFLIVITFKDVISLFAR